MSRGLTEISLDDRRMENCIQLGEKDSKVQHAYQVDAGDFVVITTNDHGTFTRAIGVPNLGYTVFLDGQNCVHIINHTTHGFASLPFYWSDVCVSFEYLILRGEGELLVFLHEGYVNLTTPPGWFIKTVEAGPDSFRVYFEGDLQKKYNIRRLQKELVAYP